MHAAHHRTFRYKLVVVSKMDLNVYIQVIFLCVANMIFTFPGIVSNTFAIASFWKSSTLREKLCHFMIMVLSCFDIVTVLTNYPRFFIYLISWLREDYDLLQKMSTYYFVILFFAFSIIQSFIAHQQPDVDFLLFLQLLSLFTLLCMHVMHVIFTNDMLISSSVVLIIFISIPPICVPQLQTVQNFQRSPSKKRNITQKRNDDKFEKYFRLFICCCLSCGSVYFSHCIHCI